MSDAILYFWGDSLQPDEISKAVGFAATSRGLKGQETKLTAGLTTTAKTGNWCFQTKNMDLGCNLVDRVAFLAREICLKARAFIENGIIQQARLSIIVSNTLPRPDSSECFELPTDIVTILAVCKVSLMLTVIWPSPED